jgi:hypothetical protein
MPKRRMSRKRGGASYELTGAPLDYALTPGATAFTTNPAVAVYDRFPIDPTVNPQVASDLDVFFGSALSRGCGIENSSLQVPANMGSNQVGGKRRKTRNYRGGNNSSITTPGFFDNFKNNLGNIGSSALNHPYMSTARPTIPHSLAHQWQGRVDSIPSSPDPTDHTWNYATEKPIDPVPTGDLKFTPIDTVGSIYSKVVNSTTSGTGASGAPPGASGTGASGSGASGVVTGGGRRRKSSRRTRIRNRKTLRTTRSSKRKYTKRH